METTFGPLAPHHMSELVVGIVLMLLIFLVMWKVVVPRFEALYAERASAIQGGMDRAEKAQAEAQAALEEYNHQLASAREEAAKIREDAKNQGAQMIAESRDKATREQARIAETAKAQIEAERTAAAQQLRADVGGLATTLAGKIVGESLTDDERARRTVDRFLDELESSTAGQN